MSQTKIKYPNSVLQFRQRLGFTQQQLAEMIGCKYRRSIWLIESGSVMPTAVVMLRLAAALRVQVEFMYRETFIHLRVEVHATEERMTKGQQGVLPLPA